MIIPIQQRKEGVLDKAYELKDRLSNFRVKVDDTDKSPGWKFAEAEMRGIPVRVEIGPKDIEAGKCVLARRDTGEKLECALDELEAKIAELMETIQKDMLEKARKHRESHTYVAKNMEEMGNILNNTPGFVKAMWTRSKSSLQQQAAACRSSRKHCPIPVYAAESLQRRWFTGARHIKFNQKTGAACNEKGMQRLFQRCHRAEKYGIMSTEEIQSGDRV